MKVALALVFVASVLVGVSLTMAPFHWAVDGSFPMNGVHVGDSPAYLLARDRVLTGKFALQDYGATLFIASILLGYLKWRPIKAPRSAAGFVVIAIAAPILTAIALGFDLVQGQARLEFAPWESFPGATLGIPALLVVGLAWAFGHFTLLAGVRKCSALVSFKAVRYGHAWLFFAFVLSALLTLGMAVLGAWWYVIPGIVWGYFYAAIASVRYEQQDSQSHPGGA